MVGIDLRYQQRLFIRNLKQQGVLDSHFDQVLDITDEENPRFLLEVIAMYLTDADTCVAEIHRLLNQPFTDYGRIVSYTHQLRGSSSSVGGRLVAIACSEVHLAIDEMNQDWCCEAFARLKNEYQNLKNNFNIITEIESTIVANKARRRNAHP